MVVHANNLLTVSYQKLSKYIFKTAINFGFCVLKYIVYCVNSKSLWNVWHKTRDYLIKGKVNVIATFEGTCVYITCQCRFHSIQACKHRLSEKYRKPQKIIMAWDINIMHPLHLDSLR